MRDRAESAATTRSNPARNLSVVETYADVTGEVVKKRLRAARQPNKGCAVWQVPINMWEWVREWVDEAQRQRWQGQGERRPPTRHERPIAAAARGMGRGGIHCIL